jgi:prephenate dehydratase
MSSPLRVGVSGVPGSFSESAAKLYLTKKNLTGQLVYLTSVENVLEALDTGDVQYGICPVENSTGGVVLETIYALSRHLCTIQELFNIEVVQNLLMHPEAKAEDITEITSHDQALKQCRMTLKREYPDAELTEYADTAKAAEDLAAGILPKTTAVIASLQAAELYHLTVLAEGVQDLKYNFTSFLAITKNASV